MVHIVGLVSGPHHFPCKNCGFRGFLLIKFSERDTKFSLLSGVLVQKQAFQKRDGRNPLFQYFAVVVVGVC